MKRTTVAILGAGLSFVTMQSASAQKTVNQYGNTFTVSQTETTTNGSFDTGTVAGTEGNDTLQTLAGAGKATITFVSGAPSQSFDNNPAAFADAGGGANGAGGKLQMNDGTPTVTQFTFADPAAPNGETLTNIILSTLGVGSGRGLYDVDFSYSTDGVTFTKFLTASDFNGTGTQYEQLTANAFGGKITGVRALQLTARNVPFNPGGGGVGSYFSELDVDATPTPAAAPEPSQTAALGLGVLGLAALVFKARKRNIA